MHLNCKGEYRLFGGLIKLTNSSTITPNCTIPTEQGWNAVAVSKSIAVKVFFLKVGFYS
jgi:hypothetical protein